MITSYIVACNIKYTGQVYYEPNGGKNIWLMRFMATKDLNLLLKVKKKL